MVVEQYKQRVREETEPDASRWTRASHNRARVCRFFALYSHASAMQHRSPRANDVVEYPPRYPVVPIRLLVRIAQNDKTNVAARREGH